MCLCLSFCSTPEFFKFSIFAFFTQVFTALLRISLFGQHDHLAASVASGRLIRGGILQLFKIVFIGPIPDIHLRLKAVPARRTFLPVSGVLICRMMTAKRITPVVATAT